MPEMEPPGDSALAPSVPAMFEQMLQVLKKLEDRMKDLEDRLLRSEGNTSRESFPQFPLLPPEIRCLIWDMCLQPRKLCVDSYAGGDKWNQRAFKSLGLSPPIISQVCQESRSVATRRGGMFRLVYNKVLWDLSAWDEHTYGYYTWFDGSRDVLELHSGRKPLGYDALLEKAEAIAIEVFDLQGSNEDLSFRERYSNDGLFDTFKDVSPIRPRKLKRIYVMESDIYKVEVLRWGSKAVASLFGGGTFSILDLGNPAEIERVQKILVNGADYGIIQRRIEKWRKHHPTSDVGPDVQNNIKTKWLAAKKGVTPAEMREMRKVEGAVSDSWVNDALKDMPSVRPVLVFALEKGRHAMQRTAFHKSPGECI